MTTDTHRPTSAETLTVRARFKTRLFTQFLRFSPLNAKNLDETKLVAFANGLNTKVPSRPLRKLTSSHMVATYQHAGMSIYDIRHDESDTAEEVVFYIHGGAYILDFLPIHWSIVKRLLQLFNVRIVAPVYPLAPAYSVDTITDKLYTALLDTMQTHGAKNVTIMGDSAGGSLALVLAQRLKNSGQPQPKQLVLFSPLLDATLSNPAIPQVAKKDTLLSVPTLKTAIELYRGNRQLNDPIMSPIHGDLSGLAPIVLFTGTRDILYPDIDKLAALLKNNGHDYSYFKYTGAFHVFVAINSRDAREAMSRIKLPRR